MADPERRAVLHLRYLHVRPEVWSKCCKRRHCFRCRIKDFHDGYTCNEFMAMQVPPTHHQIIPHTE
jgi:hypothetical protein